MTAALVPPPLHGGHMHVAEALVVRFGGTAWLYATVLAVAGVTDVDEVLATAREYLAVATGELTPTVLVAAVLARRRATARRERLGRGPLW